MPIEPVSGSSFMLHVAVLYLVWLMDLYSTMELRCVIRTRLEQPAAMWQPVLSGRAYEDTVR